MSRCGFPESENSALFYSVPCIYSLIIKYCCDVIAAATADLFTQAELDAARQAGVDSVDITANDADVIAAATRFVELLTEDPEGDYKHHVAIVAFGAVVVLTMIAAETFDPRLIWDAAEKRDDK